MSQRVLIHGFHAVTARLRHHPESIQVIYLDESRRDRRAKDLIKAAGGRAIALAVGMAGPEDIVLIAGKGHEAVQILKDRAAAFDDREAAREALRKRNSKR